MELHVCKDYDDLCEHLANWMVDCICKTLATKERFSIAFTGGNTAKRLYTLLAGDAYKNKIDWSRANIFIGDERFVPYSDERSNARMIRETLLDHVSANEAHVHFMQTENMTAETSAAEYEEVLQHYFNKGTNEPTFDIVLLGMGDDAHTLSLFPGHADAVNEQTKWCTYLWLEQQNMYRITITAPITNAAHSIAFIVSGSGKAAALNNVMHKPYDPKKYPSQIIKPVHGELHWFVDEAAMNGWKWFSEFINLCPCRIPTMQTGVGFAVPQLSNQRIHPYTDLLLHDLGHGLADGGPEFDAKRPWMIHHAFIGNWPLPKTNRTPYYLHDVRSIKEAILWHGGEAEKAKDQFMNLSSTERVSWLSF